MHIKIPTGSSHSLITFPIPRTKRKLLIQHRTSSALPARDTNQQPPIEASSQLSQYSPSTNLPWSNPTTTPWPAYHPTPTSATNAAVLSYPPFPSLPSFPPPLSLLPSFPPSTTANPSPPIATAHPTHAHPSWPLHAPRPCSAPHQCPDHALSYAHLRAELMRLGVTQSDLEAAFAEGGPRGNGEISAGQAGVLREL